MSDPRQAPDFLSLLTDVKDRGNGNYLACCPAHEDKSPSLSVKVDTDGTVLVHCFGGCSAQQIVESVGLELKDLFPPNLDKHSFRKSQKPRYNYKDLLFILAHESLVVFIAANDLKQGKALSDVDQQRLEQACGRIQRIKEVAENA